MWFLLEGTIDKEDLKIDFFSNKVFICYLKSLAFVCYISSEKPPENIKNSDKMYSIITYIYSIFNKKMIHMGIVQFQKKNLTTAKGRYFYSHRNF